MSNVIPIKPSIRIKENTTPRPTRIVSEEERQGLLEEIEQLEKLAASIRARFRRPEEEGTSITARMKRIEESLLKNRREDDDPSDMYR